MKIYLFLFIFLIFCLPVFPQTLEEDQITVSDNTDADDVIISDNNEITDIIEQDNSVYYINSVDFNIDGRTKDYAVLKNTEIKTGEEITGLEAFQNYIQEKNQLLQNQRVLDNSNIEYSIGEIDDKGRYPVNLIISAKDTWNFVVIPQPKYDNNTGFELVLKAREYNFLGTMTPLRIDLGFEYDEHNRASYHFMTDSNTPFKAFNLLWYFKQYNLFEYRPELSEPYHLYNTIGLSLELPFKRTIFTIGFNESFIFNEENSDDDILNYGLPDVQKGIYLSSYPFISWEIPTGFNVFKWGELIYTANLSSKINHEFSQWPLDDIRIGSFFTFNHHFDFGRIDWYGNFKNGLSFRLENTFEYDMHKNKTDEKPLSTDINAAFIIHRSYEDHFGISSRIMYRQYFLDSINENAGDVLRGILDKYIDADFIVSVNFNFTIGALQIHPSKWFKKPKLRAIDFDMHFSPFMDGAIYNGPKFKDPVNIDIFGYERFLLTGGLEIVVFPVSFRSLQLRASAGFNLSTSGIGDREIYIGTELYY